MAKQCGGELKQTYCAVCLLCWMLTKSHFIVCSENAKVRKGCVKRRRNERNDEAGEVATPTTLIPLLPMLRRQTRRVTLG